MPELVLQNYYLHYRLDLLENGISSAFYSIHLITAATLHTMIFKRLVDALSDVRTDYSASLVRFLASNKEQTDLFVIIFTSYLFFSFIFAIKFLNSFIVENNYRRMLTRWRIIDKENWWLLSKVYYKLFNKCTFEFILVNIGVVVSMP